MVVDPLAVGEERPPFGVGRRQRAEREEVDEGGRDVVGVGRAARQVHHRHVLDQVANSDRPGRVGVGGGDPAIGRAGSDADDGRRPCGGLLQDLQGRLASDGAVDAAIGRRYGALHHHQVVASFDRGLPGRLGVRPGGGHDRLVIVDRQHVEHDVCDSGIARAQERLRVPGAILELEPDQPWLVDRLEGGCHLTRVPARQTQQRRETGAISEERPPVDAVPGEPVEERWVGVDGRCHLSSSLTGHVPRMRPE